MLREVKNEDGSVKRWTEMRFRAPIPGIKADFTRSIRARFKRNADKILNHLRDKANEVIKYQGSHTGYSEVKVFWDAEESKEMTPSQKVALLLTLTGVLQSDSRKALKLASEVPGF